MFLFPEGEGVVVELLEAPDEEEAMFGGHYMRSLTIYTHRLVYICSSKKGTLLHMPLDSTAVSQTAAYYSLLVLVLSTYNVE